MGYSHTNIRFLKNSIPVSSIYIWSKNFSHSSMQKSEAKYGGNWMSYSTFQSSVRQFHWMALTKNIQISAQGTESLKLTYYSLQFPPSLASLSATLVLTPDIYRAHCGILPFTTIFTTTQSYTPGRGGRRMWTGFYTNAKRFYLSCGQQWTIYTWKADFSQLRNQKVKPKMAEFEAILVRHPQSPTRTVKYIAVQPCT